MCLYVHTKCYIIIRHIIYHRSYRYNIYIYIHTNNNDNNIYIYIYIYIIYLFKGLPWTPAGLPLKEGGESKPMLKNGTPSDSPRNGIPHLSQASPCTSPCNSACPSARAQPRLFACEEELTEALRSSQPHGCPRSYTWAPRWLRTGTREAQRACTMYKCVLH